MNKRKPVPRISEAEWEVLRVLWKRSPMSAQEIIDAMSGHPKTIKTYLSRLVNKGVIGFEKEGRRYSYFPKVERKECEKSVSLDFLNRVFKGALVPMVSQFVEENRLSEKEIEELKAILNERQKK